MINPHAPANTPGIRHVAFAVEDTDAVVAGLRARGAQLVGEIWCDGAAMPNGGPAGASRARAEHLIQLKEEVEAQVARYPERVTFARIPRERNGVADELAKDGAQVSKALSADRR